MNKLSSFTFVAKTDAQILILGSMPSEQSLAQQQYYAHPRNAFWKIITELFNLPLDLNYQEKRSALTEHKIALWDVIQSCEREGSLDSNIKSVMTNNFAEFFAQHTDIKHIFFNGSCAYNEYQKRVLPNLAKVWQDLPRTRLPSTSPAMASLTFEEKLTAWQQIKIN
ncbi:hypothetical protein BAC3_00813 [uncultured bacterium]|nr:hypothetical protein BAC3_00813 [uncultured bacterium]